MTVVLLLNSQANVTGVAQLSFPPAPTPVTRTSHSLVVRARLQAAATARLKAALYEAGINRSGDIVSALLTTVFTDYVFAIPDANAATIRGYTNLEARVQGLSFGALAAFDIADIKLLLPSPASATAFIAGGYDAGVGADSATLSIFNVTSKAAGDSGTGTESATVTSAVAPTPVLPALALEVSFDADSGPTYKESVMIAQPHVYYRFGETSGSAVDQMSNLNQNVYPGVTRGQSSLLPGDSNLSYDFNGTSGMLSISDVGQLDGDELTLEGVYDPDSITGVRSLQHRSHESPLYHDIWHWYIENGYMTLRIAEGITVPDPESGLPTPEPNLFTYKSTFLLSTTGAYHLAVTVKDTSVDFYVDGILVDTVPKSFTGIYRSSISIYTIGAHWSGSAYEQFYDGKMDEPAVFLRCLEPEEISYHSAARAAVPSYSWVLISGDTLANSYLKQLSTKRGSQDIFREVETGVLTGILHNNDRRFDPGNTSSPYYPNFRPARPVRLRATKDGISRDLFRGDIEDFPQDWQGRSNDVPLTALDALDVLSGVQIRITRPEELSGARIHAILDRAAWPQDLRLIDPGEERIAAWTDKEGAAKELLFKIKDAESGYIFINGSGQVVFQQRNKRFAPPFSTVKATFSNIPSVGEFPIVDAKVIEDKDQIKNHVRIKIEDSEEVAVAQDAQSILDSRMRSHQEELPLTSITAAKLRAEWILSLYRNPIFRISDVVIEPQMDNALWAHALDREIGDRLRFKIFPPGKPGTMHDLQANIEYIEHRYTVGRWTTLWKVSVADTSHYWILGTDQLGIGTKLAY